MSSAPVPHSPDDSDPTVHVEAPSPEELLCANAGRILGDLLNQGISGTEHEGDSIGPYRLCEMLGEGGFGNVWRAEQTEVVKREVAVKVIKLGMDTAQVLGRFNQERQALASLDHPNIATMLDAGVGPNGRPYFAMELVRGGAITKWCETHEATLHERLRLFIQVCQAVHHAHEKGILHRDLKPSNVMVTVIDGQPETKVIDFGIAKAINASPEELTMLTQADQVVGTPIYMSPEQIQSVRELDARSDVYALGMLLYELLTGLLPFDTTAMGAAFGIEELKRLALETVPERPSTRLRRKTTTQTLATSRFRARLSTLPADLDWITMRALEKDRARRYPSAAEFAADVQRYLAGEPVLARGPRLTYAVSRWARRHRKPLMASCLGAVIGTGVIMATLRPPAPSFASKPKLAAVAESPTRYPITLDQAEAAKEGFTNSLGMKFIPVAGTDVMFCLHETRFRDYAAYAAAVPGINERWKDQRAEGFTLTEKADDHPVTGVNWEEAQAFCQWLSRKEGRTYRLPTDKEWSFAALVGQEEDWAQDTTPESVNKDSRAYPWGNVWPPQWRAGNYSDVSRQTKVPEPATGAEYVVGYDDGFPTTALVMSAASNRAGLYDIGGNVWEWTADWFNHKQKQRALRGASWTVADFSKTLSSYRQPQAPETRDAQTGFRCVLLP